MLGLLLLQVLASCLWLGHSEVVMSFTDCPQFFCRNTTPDNALEPQDPARICQCYKNQYHFATLYDRDLHIPVYSAYTYRLGPGSRSKLWFVEPQVNESYPKRDMDTEKSIEKQYKVTPQQIGQLIYLQPHQRSAPQKHTQQGCHWTHSENQTMAQNTQGCTATYVITGAVPGNRYISNNRVNVPSHICSAACCQTNKILKTWAAITANNNNQVPNLTLGQLEARLSQLYGRGQVSLFHSAFPH
uniref:ENDD1 protein n=1 Tax=Cyanoderma ruficeps TaxID=181631 RepID=A0A8C3NSM3_9PASS